jgi:hypothetical protein
MMLPALVRALSLRWAEWSREETKKRHQGKEVIMRATAIELAMAGIRPTFYRVIKHLDGKVAYYSTVRPNCHTICQEVAEEFGWI